MSKTIYKQLTKEKIEKLYVGTSVSGGKIAKSLGMSYSTFKRALDLHGIKTRGIGRISENEKIRDKEWLKNQYLVEMKSCSEIAHEIGTTSGNVHSALRNSGVELRSSESSRSIKYPNGRFGPDSSNWKGGHRIPKNKKSYVRVYARKHPYAKAGYVLEHRLVMENKIGRFLSPTEVVHHLNSDKQDNRVENLQLLESRAQHVKVHYDAVKEVERLKAILTQHNISF